MSRWPGSSVVPGWLGKARLPAGVGTVGRTSIAAETDCPASPIYPSTVAVEKLELLSDTVTATVERMSSL
jgi:hypothetical protein